MAADRQLRNHVLAMAASLDTIMNRMERVLRFNDAVSLAFEERTGIPLEPGDAYTEADAKRANEIMQQCWRNRGYS